VLAGERFDEVLNQQDGNHNGGSDHDPVIADEFEQSIHKAGLVRSD
jgi:hypothetical protein